MKVDSFQCCNTGNIYVSKTFFVKVSDTDAVFLTFRYFSISSNYVPGEAAELRIGETAVKFTTVR